MNDVSMNHTWWCVWCQCHAEAVPPYFPPGGAIVPVGLPVVIFIAFVVAAVTAVGWDSEQLPA